jgi:hypothetical protein
VESHRPPGIGRHVVSKEVTLLQERSGRPTEIAQYKLFRYNSCEFNGAQTLDPIEIGQVWKYIHIAA